MDNPLVGPGLERLRERRSVKWRLYDPDILPLWVAEMDVVPAEPIQRAVADAMTSGDTGYPWAADYAEALSSFAATRWGWEPDPATMEIVPDVMLGVVEVLKLVTDPGAPVVVNSPVYPPFFQFVTHLGHPVVEAPLGEDGRLDLVTLERAFGEATSGGGRAAYLLCNPQNPTGAVHTRRGAHRGTGAGGVVRRARRRRRDPRAGRARPGDLHLGRLAARGVTGDRADVGLEGVQPGRAQGGDGGARPGRGRRPRPDAGGGVPRREPPRGDRPPGGLPRGRCLARRPARRPRLEPAPAGRPARRTAARSGLPGARGDVPRLARLHSAWASATTRRRCCASGPGWRCTPAPGSGTAAPVMRG